MHIIQCLCCALTSRGFVKNRRRTKAFKCTLEFHQGSMDTSSFVGFQSELHEERLAYTAYTFGNCPSVFVLQNTA